MKFYFVVNGFLGSQGTIEFINNCHFTVNKYWMSLGLSKEPELIFIEELKCLNFIKRIIKKELNKSDISNENNQFFKENNIKRLKLFEYYKLKLNNENIFVGNISLQKLIFTDIGYIFDCQHFYLKNNFNFLQRTYRSTIFFITLLFAKRILVNSLSVKNDLKRFYPIINSQKIINLPFMPIIKNKNYNNNFLLTKFNYDFLKDSKKFILISNRWWDHKNHLIVIKAFNEIKYYLEKTSNFDNYFLVISGSIKGNRDSTNVANKAINYIKKNDLEKNVLILGHVPDDFHNLLISKCVGIIQPTLFEGGPGGFSAWEAIGMNKPLALSNIRINKELKDYVQDLIYFNPYSKVQIKNILLKLFNGEIKIPKCNTLDLNQLEFNYAKKIVDNK
tara:strand:+ start:499 stop:1668 length:1170 start_codon:yes stop_codon:yes gene_type:complete